MDEKRLGISNVILVHGTSVKDRENMKKYNLPTQNKRGWFAWIKSELEKRGVVTICPLMPRCWNPKYEEWKEEFEKIDIDENSVLVGWSSGGAFLVRWLWGRKRKIKKLILVAPAIKDKGKEEWENDDFHNFKIDRGVIDLAEKIVLIESSDDSGGIKKSCKVYSDVLGIKSIVLKDRGHFTQRGVNDNRDFPELLEEILK